MGGLEVRPVIGVPSSVGYRALQGGPAALLPMLHSCAAGVTVVHLDEGSRAGPATAPTPRTFLHGEARS